MSDFSKLLNAYGFKTETQQLNVIRLLYLAGCFDQDKLYVDLIATGHASLQIESAMELVRQAISGDQHSKNLEKFNAKLILDKLFFSSYEVAEKGGWPENIHNWFIKVTQREFFARKAGQERWQQETGKWMTEYETEVREISNQLGLQREVTPTQQAYKAIVVFGATLPEMEKRLAYTKELTKTIKTKHLYLLAGERPADSAVDGSQEDLQIIASKQGIPIDKVTETHLMWEAYQKTKKEEDDNFAQLPFTVIDTPKRNKPRPNTIDTLTELFTKNPDISGNMLFISRAPNIRAQAEDTFSIILTQHPQCRPEIVGDSCEGVSLNRQIGALGGALFGGYCRVAYELGCQISNQVLETKRNELSFNAQQQISSVQSVNIKQFVT